MKIKYIILGIIVLVLLPFAASLAMAIGTCGFLGMVIIGLLDSWGVITIKDDKTALIISVILGAAMFFIYYAMKGHF